MHILKNVYVWTIIQVLCAAKNCNEQSEKTLKLTLFRSISLMVATADSRRRKIRLQRGGNLWYFWLFHSFSMNSLHLFHIWNGKNDFSEIFGEFILSIYSFFRVFLDWISAKMPILTSYWIIRMKGKWVKSRMKMVEKNDCPYFMTGNQWQEK